MKNFIIIMIIIIAGGIVLFFSQDNSPKIKGVDKNVTLHVGDEHNEINKLKVSDDRDELTIEQSGGVDSSEPGHYTVLFSAKDSSGNFTGEWQDVTVIK